MPTSDILNDIISSDCNPVLKTIIHNYHTKNTFVKAVMFLCVLLVIGAIFFKPISQYFILSIWVNTIIVVLTFIGVAYFLFKVHALKSTEESLLKMAFPAGYEDEYKYSKGYLIHDAVCDFFEKIDGYSPYTAKLLSCDINHNMACLILPLRYLGRFLILIGLLGVVGIILDSLSLYPNIFNVMGEGTGSNVVFDKSDVINKIISGALGILLLSIIGFSILYFLEWCFIDLVEKMSLFVQNQFLNRVHVIEKLLDTTSLTSDISLSRGNNDLLYKKMFELTDTVSTLKNNFFVAQNNNINLETLRQSLLDIITPQIEHIQGILGKIETAPISVILDDVSSRFNSLESDLKIYTQQISDLLKKYDMGIKHAVEECFNNINAQLVQNKKIDGNMDIHALSDIVMASDTHIKDIGNKLEKISTDISDKKKQDFDLKAEIALLKTFLDKNPSMDILHNDIKNVEKHIGQLQKDTQNIDNGLQSLSKAHFEHKDDLSALRVFLSNELKTIKVDNKKPIMFMQVQDNLNLSDVEI